MSLSTKIVGDERPIHLVMSYQIETILIEIRGKSRKVFRTAFEALLKKKDANSWLAVYICTLINLVRLSLLMKHNADRASKYYLSVGSRTTNFSLGLLLIKIV
jgi:hypothetical protein